jgi:hypothetical protein
MIDILSLNVISEDGSTEKKPISAHFGNGITIIPYIQKNIFDYLNFKLSKILSGSITIDGKKIDKNSNSSHQIYCVETGIKKYIEITAIFPSLLSAADSQNQKSFLKESLSRISQLSSSTNVDNYNKFLSLLDILRSCGVGYITIDANRKVNKDKLGIIQKIETGTNLTIIVLANKDSATSISEGKNCNIRHNLDAKNRLFKICCFLLMLFSMCSLISIFAAACFFIENKWLLGLTLFFAFVLFLSADLFISSIFVQFASKERNNEDYLLAEIIGSFSSVIGIVIAAVTVYFLGKKDILYSLVDMPQIAMAITAVLGCVLFLMPLASHQLDILFKKIYSYLLFKK